MTVDEIVVQSYRAKCTKTRDKSPHEYILKSGVVKEIKGDFVCALCTHYMPIAIKDYCCGETFQYLEKAAFSKRFSGIGGYDE